MTERTLVHLEKEEDALLTLLSCELQLLGKITESVMKKVGIRVPRCLHRLAEAVA